MQRSQYLDIWKVLPRVHFLWDYGECFFWHAVVKDKENPFKLLRSKKILSESAASGVGGILASFAYLFAPASVIVAAQRSSAMCWSVVAGALHFHERHMYEKVSVLGLTIMGIILLIR